MEKQKLPNATLILVFGIISIVTCCCYGVVGLIFGIVAVVLASKAKKLYLQNPEEYEGYNNVKIGNILAIIGIVFNVLFLAYVIWAISFFGWEALQDPDQMRNILEGY